MLQPNTPELAWLGLVFSTALGLVLGSFVNVLIYRLPRGKSVVFPPSACPACGEGIRPYDNIPVLSYLLLGGRCRHCRERISLRYPFVEAVVGAASLAAFWRHGASLEAACELGFAAAVVSLVFIDYDHRILPNVVTIPGIVAGLAVAGPRQTISLLESVAGVALGAGVLLLVAEVYFRVRHIEGLGMGDVKMMGMVGAFLGWKGAVLTLFVGSLLGSLVGVAIMAVQGKDLKTALPFGAFLGMAALVAMFVGPALLNWYTGMF